jgi:hypothetical protein
MSKHTPGPWKISTSRIKKQLQWAEVVVDGHCVADIPVDFVAIDEAETMANAKLIAAAPELLEALELAVELLKGHEISKQDHQQLLNAIKKATE